MNEDLATNGFRGMVEAELRAIRNSLADMKVWTAKHETEEFSFHGRVEAQMLETARVMASSIENRHDLSRRINEIEGEIKDVWKLLHSVRRDVTLMLGGLIIVNLVVLPIAFWMVHWIVNHK